MTLNASGNITEGGIGGSSTPNNAAGLNSHDHVASGGSAGGGGGGSGKFNSEHESECSSVTSDSMPGGWVLKLEN